MHFLTFPAIWIKSQYGKCLEQSSNLQYCHPLVLVSNTTRNAAIGRSEIQTYSLIEYSFSRHRHVRRIQCNAQIRIEADIVNQRNCPVSTERLITAVPQVLRKWSSLV